MSQRQWNTIASLAVGVIVVYVGTAAALVIMGRIEFAAFTGAMAPVATAVLGYMARMAAESA